MSKFAIVEEFFDFLLHSKKYWLMPIVMVLLMLFALIILATPAAAPFIYTIF